jgi:hypothetical protein
MTMTNLRPVEIQQIIDKIVSYRLTDIQCNALCRSLDIETGDIFSVNQTPNQKIDALVTKVIQLGIHEELLVQVERIKSSDERVDNHLSYTHQLKISRLDTLTAKRFGILYQELLSSLDTKKRTEQNEVEKDKDDEKEKKDFIDFVNKLKNKARFSESNQTLGIDSKNENAVLKRKAQKLGYENYGEINTKVRNYYNNRILVVFPPDHNRADFRLKMLVEELFESLPDHLQDEKALDYLYGIIFDTMSQCLIFNE